MVQCMLQSQRTTHSGLTEGLALVFLHEAEHYQTEDEESHEGHGSSGHYPQHGHLHARLQELWGQNNRES